MEQPRVRLATITEQRSLFHQELLAADHKRESVRFREDGHSLWDGLSYGDTFKQHIPFLAQKIRSRGFKIRGMVEGECNATDTAFIDYTKGEVAINQHMPYDLQFRAGTHEFSHILTTSEDCLRNPRLFYSLQGEHEILAETTACVALKLMGMDIKATALNYCLFFSQRQQIEGKLAASSVIHHYAGLIDDAVMQIIDGWDEHNQAFV